MPLRRLLGNNVEDCPTDMSEIAFINGWLLIGGTVIAFLPQHLKISRRKSHIGVSAWFVILSNCVSWLLLVNYVTLEYRSTFTCCTADTSTYGCIASLLAFGQETTILACTCVLLFLYVYFYDHDTMDILELDQGYAPGVGFRKLKRGLQIYASAIFLAILLDVIFIWQLGLDDPVTKLYGEILGITGALLELVLWFPQLATSWRLGHAGSFSVAMLVLQIIGAGMSYYNLALHGDFYIWVPFIGRGMLELALLLELCYLRFFTERGRKHALFDLPPFLSRCLDLDQEYVEPDESLYDDLLSVSGNTAAQPLRLSKQNNKGNLQDEYLIVQ
eukprot:g8089.t1